jgi:hypothetical protein
MSTIYNPTGAPGLADGSRTKFTPPVGTGKDLVWIEKQMEMMQRADLHPCTPEEFTDILPDKSTRYYAIKRMRETKKLRFVGFFQDGRGRPCDVYCNGWFPNKLAHEVKLTKLLLKYQYRTERGPEVDKLYRPDWTWFLPSGQVWHGEFDTGHQRGDQINNRWRVYESLAKEYAKKDGRMLPAVLVVTQRRDLAGLLMRAAPYAAFIHFASYDKLLADPFGKLILPVTFRQESGSVPVFGEPQAFKGLEN